MSDEADKLKTISTFSKSIEGVISPHASSQISIPKDKSFLLTCKFKGLNVFDKSKSNLVKSKTSSLIEIPDLNHLSS